MPATGDKASVTEWSSRYHSIAIWRRLDFNHARRIERGSGLSICALCFLLRQAASPIVETILCDTLKTGSCVVFFVPLSLLGGGSTPSIGMVTDYCLEESL